MKKFIIVVAWPLSLFSQKLIPPKSNLTDRVIINKWIHAVVNIEARNRNQISSGTAIFVSINNRNYLLTARHVLHDPFSLDSNKITDKLILIENYTERDEGDRYDSARNSYTFVGDMHFLMFNIKPLNHRPPYLFSTIKEDLAIIDLGQEIGGQSFANTLFKRGYRPITLNDIDTTCDIKYGDRIFAVGFPQESEVDTNHIGPVLKYRSRFVSIPIVSEGILNGRFDSLYFDAYLSIYHGFSGGPIIRNNKLMGIVHGSDPKLNKTTSSQLPFYVFFQLSLIRSNLIMPLIRRLRYQHF